MQIGITEAEPESVAEVPKKIQFRNLLRLGRQAPEKLEIALHIRGMGAGGGGEMAKDAAPNLHLVSFGLVSVLLPHGFHLCQPVERRACRHRTSLL